MPLVINVPIASRPSKKAGLTNQVNWNAHITAGHFRARETVKPFPNRKQEDKRSHPNVPVLEHFPQQFVRVYYSFLRGILIRQTKPQFPPLMC